MGSPLYLVRTGVLPQVYLYERLNTLKRILRNRDLSLATLGGNKNSLRKAIEHQCKTYLRIFALLGLHFFCNLVLDIEDSLDWDDEGFDIISHFCCYSRLSTAYFGLKGTFKFSNKRKENLETKYQTRPYNQTKQCNSQEAKYKTKTQDYRTCGYWNIDSINANLKLVDESKRICYTSMNQNHLQSICL